MSVGHDLGATSLSGLDTPFPFLPSCAWDLPLVQFCLGTVRVSSWSHSGNPLSCYKRSGFWDVCCCLGVRLCGTRGAGMHTGRGGAAGALWASASASTERRVGDHSLHVFTCCECPPSTSREASQDHTLGVSRAGL